ncbi:RpiR family transcriptional regulator [Actinoplanes sp. SE50]|uniref:MurR/RpiR family transcriptional regulator n=1 Tax=unclassified Actinoplanes TaxID=2626549 RepID=UPI00023EC624|nr:MULTISPECIES: MurR/RpiR family transcriptional regulator [unclassified Actinoplanes]AEV84680.1 HTH-type transcriptional regulator hexR [Actinoplanes sp. SE50/110]ATO83072.1 RpiR family transcriptional regulator [Actinoplanes sp. SE50]SLM00479.1 RpiR family transcriptional regulator [Actinoplanes sp. SE50/110]
MSTPNEDLGPAVGVAGLIRARWAECSPAERKVARVLLAAYPQAGLETVAALAGRAGVSAPTVLRLAGRLGFTGFPELQKALRQELTERDVSPLTTYSAGRSTAAADGGALERAAAILPGVLATALAETPPAEFDAAVRLLADRQLTVTLAGGRFSRLLAEYLLLHLMQVRGGARLLPAGAVERANTLVDVGRRDLLVIFDFRRYEDWSLALARAATEAGARVVLVTDRWLSPIAAVAEAVLACPVDSPSAYDSFVPALAVLETVIAGVIDRLGAPAGERLARIEEASRRFTLL